MLPSSSSTARQTATSSREGKNLADALGVAIGAGGKVTYTLIDGAGHGGTQFSTETNMKEVVDFLDKHLK